MTDREFEERVEILTRFRDALVRQREKFRSYLDLLEREELEEPEGGRLELHLAMEKSIIAEIAAFERSIEPLEMLYRESDVKAAGEFPRLRAALDRTRNAVVRRHERNALLLRAQIEELRAEIAELRVATRRNAVYSSPEPALVDLHAYSIPTL